MNEMVKHMKKHALDEEADDVNYAVFDLEQEPIETVVEEAETLPFIGNRRLIVAHNAWFLTGSRVKKMVEHRLDQLEAYAQSPLETSILVLTVPHEKLDERKKCVKAIKKQGLTVKLTPLGKSQLPKWIQQKIEHFGARIEAEAAQLLIRLAGSDLQLLYQECAKLATFVGPGETVTSEHVKAMIPRSLEEDIFKLVNHIGKKQNESALGIFYDLLKRREEPLKILSLITRQFRIMLQVRELMSQGYSQKQMAAKLGLHPYAVKIAATQSRQFSNQALQTLLREAKSTDYAIKSGQKEKTLAVEWYLLGLNKWVNV